MKKLLLLFTVVLATLTASAQAVQTRIGSRANQVPKNAPIAAINKPAYLQRHAASLQRRSPRKIGIGSFLAGDYIMTLISAFDDGAAYNVCSNVKVTALGTDSIVLTGVNYYGNIHAKVNSDNTIEIPSQVVYTSRTYGKESIVKFTVDDNYNVNLSRNEKISGFVDSESGTIYILDHWGLFIDSGDYADSYFDLWNTSALQKPNGTFTFSNPSMTNGKDTTVNVAIAEYGDTLISVSNFASYGDGGFYVEMNLAKDSSVTVLPQYVYAGSEDDGNYFISGLQGNNLIIETGKGDANSITLEPFTLYSDSGYWFNEYTHNVLTYTYEGDKFTYPTNDATGIRNVSVADRKTAIRTEYYNAAGARSSVPQKGLNIVVTRYADGSSDVRKVIKK